MTRLFNPAAGRGLSSSRYARLGQAPTGDLQKRRYTNNVLALMNTFYEAGTAGGLRVFCQSIDLRLYIFFKFVKPVPDVEWHVAFGNGFCYSIIINMPGDTAEIHT